MVKIIGDTTSGLPEEVVQKYGIPIIPQVIIFGEESFLEGVEMDNAAFMRRLKAAEDLPKTAAPPPELFVKEFERVVPTGESIICILPSSVVSGTVRSAMVAARDFSGADIRIVDTELIASPVATLLELAGQWAEEGKSADAIERGIYDMLPRCRVYFYVDTLKYLAKGGRIGGAAALLGGVLKVKPVLTLDRGRVETFEKIRTKKRAIARLKELVTEQIDSNIERYLSVMHAGIPEEAQALADELVALLSLPYEPRILDVPPAIVTHGGPGILGVSFFVSGATEEGASCAFAD
ncbi:MAG: DegV family protein [Anaerolineae bacterium]